MANYVRPRHGNPVMMHPDGYIVTTDPNTPMRADDPLVKKYPWAFATDEELLAEAEQPRRAVESVAVEQTTKRPGEKRAVRRAK